MAVLEDLVVKFRGDTTQINRNLKSLDRNLKTTESQAARLKSSFGGMGRALVAGLGAGMLIRNMKGVVNEMDSMGKAARRLGVDMESFSALKHAADLSGLAISDLEMGIRTMQRAMTGANEGLTTYQRGFDRIGVSVKDLQGLNTEEQFIKLADALSKMPNISERNATAMEIFGRAGLKVINMAEDGAEGIKKMTDEARKLGVVFDEEAARKAEKFNDDLTRLQAQWRGLLIDFADTGALNVLSEGLLTLASLARDAAVAYGDLLRAFGVKFNAADTVKSLTDELTKQLEFERKNLRGLKGEGFSGFMNELFLDEKQLTKQIDKSINEIKRLERNLDNLQKTYNKDGSLVEEKKVSRKGGAKPVIATPEAIESVEKLNEKVKEVKESTEELDRTTESFIDDLVRGIGNGADAWDVFRQAGLSALKDVASEMLKSQFGGKGIGSSVSSGIGGILGSIGGSLKDFLPSFDSGGFTGSRQGAGVDGKGGFPAILHPEEMVLNKQQMNSVKSGGGASVTQYVNLQTTSDKDIQRVVMSMMPRFVEAAQSAVNSSIAGGGETSRLVGLRR